MIPKHKTIVCIAKDFDEQFDKWIKSLDLLPYQSFNKIDIKHEEDYHYILYVIHNELKRSK